MPCPVFRVDMHLSMAELSSRIVDVVSCWRNAIETREGAATKAGAATTVEAETEDLATEISGWLDSVDGRQTDGLAVGTRMGAGSQEVIEMTGEVDTRAEAERHDAGSKAAGPIAVEVGDTEMRGVAKTGEGEAMAPAMSAVLDVVEMHGIEKYQRAVNTPRSDGVVELEYSQLMIPCRSRV